MITMQKIDWNPSLIKDIVGAVSYNYFHPETGEKIDSEKICEDLTIIIKIPIDLNKTVVNMTLYEYYRDRSVNIYDRESSFYNSRCINFVDPSSEFDIVLSDRRENIFPNMSFACSVGCDFEGIDKNHYVICDCVPENKTDASVSNGGFFDAISDSNLDIVICVGSAFDSQVLLTNPGFWCNGSFMLAFAVCWIFIKLLHLGALSKNMEFYIKTDATLFNKDIFDDNKTVKVNNINDTPVIHHKIPSDVIPVPNPPLPKDDEDILWIDNKTKQEENSKQINSNSIGNREIILNKKYQDDFSKSLETINMGLNNNAPIYENNYNDIKNIDNNFNLKIDEDIIEDNDSNNEYLKIQSNKNINNKLALASERENPSVNNSIETKEKLNLKQFKNDFSQMDYTIMDYEEIIKLDKRSFKEYYIDRLLDLHNFFRAFYYKTLLIPQTLRLISFFLIISFSFALNAIFYSDTFIQQKTKNYSPTTNDFLYTLTYQFSKSIWSILIGSIPIILLNLLLIVPEQFYKKFNKALLKVKEKKIIKATSKLYKKMRWRYFLFVVLAVILHLFSWFYVTVFCGIYVKSSRSWIYGGLISVLIDMCVIKFSIPLLHTLIRTWAKNSPENKFAKYSYIICLKLF